MRRPLVLALLLCAALLSLVAGCSSTSQKKAALGDPCVPGQNQCADGLCVALDNNSGFCSRNCQADGVCPDGFRCEDAGANGLICKRPAACKVDLDCPSGHRCDTSTGECYVKVARQPCAPCTNDLQCPEGGACFTVPSSGEKYCVQACAADGSCPDGYACNSVPILKQSGGLTESKRMCVPNNPQGTCEGGRGLCAPCKGDGECGGYFDLCVRNVVSGEQFCGKVCDPSRKEDCPDGFGCTDLSGAGSGPFQCVPNSNSCKGYCDSSDEHAQVLQCGLGRQCDLKDHACQPASDGRECSPCHDNDDCRKPGHDSNTCVVNDCPDCPQKGETFCAEPCPPTDGDAQCKAHFGPGFVCTAVGQGHYCVPQRGSCVAGLGQLGDSCSANGAKDCVTGVCLSYGKTALCSATCTTDDACGDLRKYRCCDLVGDFYDCSPGHRNASNSGPASGTGVCAPNGGLFGDDCSPGRPPCQSGTCLDIGTARLCTVPCGEADVCPPDFVCREAFLDGKSDKPQKICFPDGGGAPGSDCTFGPAACADRLCIKKESGAICSKGCAGEEVCPSDWTCKNVDSAAGTKVDACVPPDLQ